MSKLIVALDDIEITKVYQYAHAFKGKVWGFKVNDLLVEHGLSIVRSLKVYGNVFADIKAHDIPNTVANIVRKLDDAGADFISVHASGGAEMLKAARWSAKRSRLLGVTVLSALDRETVNTVFHTTTELAVNRLVGLVQRAGLEGVVCAPTEVESLKGVKLLKVVPGVRPYGPVQDDDQVRVATKAVHADYLVVGRPILRAENPLAVIDDLNAQISRDES